MHVKIFEKERLMCNSSKTITERLDTITRSIASGNNACGTLIDRQNGSVNTSFIAEAARPTLNIYEAEAKQLREDIAKLSHEVEMKRQALECAISNVQGITASPVVKAAFRLALPENPYLQ